MRSSSRRWRAVLVFTFLTGTFGGGCTAIDVTADWGQWRGPNRDGVSSLARIQKTWPEGGPTEVWRRPIGEGFSGLSIANSRVFTMYSTESDEFVVGLDAVDGREVWKRRTGSRYTQTYGNGPRSTPTVDGDRVYVLGAHGELLALEAGSGRMIWQRDLRGEFGCKMPAFAFTASPLIEGNNVLVEAGGGNDDAVMAFDKMTGELVWGSGRDPVGFSSPIAVDVHGLRQIIFFTSRAVVSLSPNGQQYWRHEWHTEYGQHPATPVFIAPDRVFVSSGYGHGAAVLQITPADTGLSVGEVWFSKKMKNHIATSVYFNGAIYGFDESILKCMDAETGAERWKARGYGKGTLILADGHLIVLGEKGNLAIVEARPDAHVQVASAKVLSDRCWTSPSLAGGRLYLRNMAEIVCLDLAGKK